MPGEMSQWSPNVVDTRRGGLLQTEEARPQNINGEVMQERRQLDYEPHPRCLSLRL